MKSFISAVLGIFSLASVGAAECHGNNCARAVTGTGAHNKPELSSRRADCSSFMRTTVTPGTYTSTRTSTIYTGKLPGPPNAKRLALPEPVVDLIAPRAPVTTFPTAVPTYASACTGAAEYSSVCSCWGIIATTTTVSAPTVLVTTTKHIDVGCKTPALCPFNDVNKFRCGPGKKGWCSCLRAAEDKTQQLCVRDRHCSEVKKCKSSKDCGDGEGCVISHCCEKMGPRVCLEFAPKACNNPTRPRGIFEKRGEMRFGNSEGLSVECTAFGCGQN